MRQQPLDIERLDWAARAAVAEAYIKLNLTVAIILSCFVGFLAFMSEASTAETAACWVVAMSAAISTVAFIARWRFAYYAWAAFFLVGAVAFALFPGDPDHHTTIFGWVAHWGYSVSMLSVAWCMWKQGSPFARVASGDWIRERSRVQEWLRELISVSPENLIELPTGSFWKGYKTYRLLRFENCWAIASFKSGDLKKMMTYRICDLGSVRWIGFPANVAEIQIDGRAIRIPLGTESAERIAGLTNPA